MQYKGASTHFITTVVGEITTTSNAITYNGLQLLNSVNKSRAIQKRIFDIVFSVLIIALLLSWLIPMLALFIKITSGGNVFFVQKRTGLHNTSFNCFKLCTMVYNSSANKIQAQKNDSRITFAGNYLRRFSLDELPQFFNVLLGNMSVIGPRPHMLQHTTAFSEKIKAYHLRHLVKPGITGLSQVLGYRGEIINKQAILNRTRLDIFYIKKWCIALDMLIVLKTIKLLVVGDKNAY